MSSSSSTKATARRHLTPVAAAADAARWPESVELMVHQRTQLRRSRWRRTVQPYLVLTDLVVIALSAFLVAGPWPEIMAMAIGVPLVLGSLGIYRSRLTLSVLDDLPTIAVAALVGGVGELGLARRARRRAGRPPCSAGSPSSPPSWPRRGRPPTAWCGTPAGSGWCSTGR